MTKIYVSSTYSDLVEHRERVYDVLRKMRYDVIAMEDYVAADRRPLDKCLADVASCDLYVGIFAWRYGYIPPGQGRSITELEYRRASEFGLKRLIFLLDEDAPWPRSKMEKGAGGEKIEALRGELMAVHLVQFFRSYEQLAGQVAASVAEWAKTRLSADMDSLRAKRDQADKERREMHERERVVNVRPLDVTHTFKDRLREMRDLCDYLTDANVRLVSVVGRGGMGKTALASRVLADLERDKLPVPGEERELSIDGILYLSARSTGLGLERIYTDVGRMLGEPAASELTARWADRDTSLASKVEYLLEAMEDGLYLILLDNLEDYLTDDGEIIEEGLLLFTERCLTQPGGVRLIVTSREEVKLAAAALDNARCIPLREGLPEDDAVALLCDLDPQGRLGLCDASEEDLRRAARLAWGIPRALEMLAGILDRDPTASLSRLLTDERLFGEQVVEQLVAGGYQRLEDDEQRVMEALAVFDRPVDETAIAYLLHPWFPGLDVRTCLRRLVGGYFVGASRITGEYSLHPLDHDYAYRQLLDDEEADAYNRRNLELRAADFYVSLRKPESEWKTIEDLAPQLAEFEHRVRAGDYDGACRILEPIDFDYLSLWGHYTRLIEMREKLLGHLTDPGLRAKNLGSLGLAYYVPGQVERAVEFYDKALEIFREIGDRRGEGRQLGSLGWAYQHLGQVERAIKFYKEALAITHDIGDRRGESDWLGNLGRAYLDLGQVERAVEFYDKALEIFREIGDRRREGQVLANLSRAYRALGHFEHAIKLCEEALAIFVEMGYRKGESVCREWLGIAYRALGQVEPAIQLYEEALTIARELGDRQMEATGLAHLGLAYYDLRQVKRAIEFHEQSLAIAREIGYRLGESDQLLGLGQALLAAGEFSKAGWHCAEALLLDVPETSYYAALVLGIALLHQRDVTTGETFADAASRSRSMLDKTAGFYKARYVLAAALVGQAVCDPRWMEEGERAGLLAPALAEYRRALEKCAALGVVHDALRDLEMIRAAGVEGLEPAFELLEGYVGEKKETE